MFYSSTSTSFDVWVGTGRAVSQNFALTVLIVVVLLSAAEQLPAQGANDYTYRFQVESVTHPSEAKSILHDFSQLAFISGYRFIDAGDFFKVSSSVELSYTALQTIVEQSGHHISGKIEEDNGSIHLPPNEPLPTE